MVPTRSQQTHLQAIIGALHVSKPKDKTDIERILKRVAEAGTRGYPPDTRRRLKIVNMIAYLIAITTLLYAIQQSMMDFHTFAPMIACL